MVTRRQLNWSLLSSGSFLITAESEFPPCFQIGFLFPAGSADEAVGLEGLSQIALPLLGRETLRHSRTELQRNLDRLGAIVDSDTMEETSIVTMVFMEDHVDECLSLLREILTEPTVQKRDLAREKRKLRANFQILDQDPDVVTEAHARTAYFGPGHPLSQQARPKTVGRIKLQDCRQFWEMLMRRGPLAVFFSGPASHARLRELYCRWFGTLHTSFGSAILPAPRAEPTRRLLHRPSLQQAALHAIIPTVPRTESLYLPLRIGLYAWLEGGFSSRLMTKLRVELGGTYGIHGAYHTLRDCGFFSLQTSVNTAMLESVLTILSEEYTLLRTRGLSDAEFQETVDSFIHAFPLLWDSTPELGSHLLRQYALGVPLETVLEFPDRVRALKLEEIQRALQALPSTLPIQVVAVPNESNLPSCLSHYRRHRWLEFAS